MSRMSSGQAGHSVLNSRCFGSAEGSLNAEFRQAVAPHRRGKGEGDAAQKRLPCRKWGARAQKRRRKGVAQERAQERCREPFPSSEIRNVFTSFHLQTSRMKCHYTYIPMCTHPVQYL